MTVMDKINRLTKWKMVFAGWQLGTRPVGDPECDAVRDHREVTILLRAEVTTLIALLVEKDVCTETEFSEALGTEAEQLSADYSRRFPGFTATDDGIDINVQRASDIMKGWRP